jgi:hypothetical protein
MAGLLQLSHGAGDLAHADWIADLPMCMIAVGRSHSGQPTRSIPK